MRRIVLILVTIAFPLSVLVSADAGEKKSPPPHQGSYVPGEVLIKYKPLSRTAGTTYYRAMWGMVALRTFPRIGVDFVKLPEGLTVERAVEICRADDLNIEYVEPNYYRYALYIPDDLSLQQQWGLLNMGQEVNGIRGVADADIDAPEAWNAMPGGDPIVIAAVDSGTDITHPDLAGSIWRNPGEIPGNGMDDDGNGYIDDVSGWDFVENDNDPDDPVGHGTHVTGIIAARADNAMGIAGICWNAKVMPLKAFDATGVGTVEQELAALDYAVNQGARIINLSLGSYEMSRAEYEALAFAGSSGALVVAAAGNSAMDNDSAPLYPASYDLDNLISVAASDQNDHLADFSNFGATTVHVAAPGVSIYSCLPAIPPVLAAGYGFKTGTSMATPMVSGIAALIWSFLPTLSYHEVRQIVFESVDKLDGLQGMVLTGGRINAYRALQNVVTLPAFIVMPYMINTAHSTTFITLANRSAARVPVDMEVMDDDGNRKVVNAVTEIPSHGTQVLWANDIASLAGNNAEQAFSVRLVFGNGTVSGIRSMCLMKEQNQIQVIPAYLADMAKADMPVVLSVSALGTSSRYPTYVRVNNWSERDAPVTVTVRSRDNGKQETAGLAPVPAHATITYSASEIASQCGMSDESFSADFAVYGEGDKIFGVILREKGSGTLVMPVSRDQWTTRSMYSFY